MLPDDGRVISNFIVQALRNELITIYGRLTNVIVEKGQVVTQGQKIGEVIEDTETKRGIMHFEVRKGMKSIDPETMIR